MRSLHDLGRRLAACALSLLVACSARGQQPIDLFDDAPPLGSGFIRIGAWNLRHINIEGQAANFLTGATREEDFAILIATFAKGIQDLGLDLVAVVESQPRQNEPNRLTQLRDRLNGGAAGSWRSDETSIDYDSVSQFGGLQFGLLWNSAKIRIDPDDDALLTELRQPRNTDGTLAERTLRAPWLVPVQSGQLQFDLMILHLKSGGGPPQGEEVDAIRGYIAARQSVASPRHLIVCGDWNIRPDQSQGRTRLSELRVTTATGTPLMRVLTVEDIPPTLVEWEALGTIAFGSAQAALVPFTHYNATFIDTFLDHMAISNTMSEIFDNPIQVTLASGTTDLLPGIAIARPHISEQDFVHLTDHLPVVLTLRTSGGAAEPASVPALTIVAALPNPPGADEPAEEVHVRNNTNAPISLVGWRIGDSTGNQFWVLDAADGTIAPGATVVIVRRNRPMYLNNSGGDTIVLIDLNSVAVDRRSYGDAASGQMITFP